MQVCTPTSGRLVARGPAHLVAALRHKSTSSAAIAVTNRPLPPLSSGGPRPLRIRSRGYGPSSDLLKGIPEHVLLDVEATLHPEDAKVQRAVLAMSMPNLADVRVTPVRPHGTYGNRVPHSSGASYPSDISSEREVIEQCLRDQLEVVANLVVDQVEKRTGQRLDALHVAYDDKMKSFAEIVLNSIHDELRQLRVVRERQASTAEVSPSVASSTLPPASIDVEAVAQVVSARVVEQLAGSTLIPAPPSTTPIPAPSSDIAHQLTRLEESTAAHFDDLQRRVTAAVEGRDVPAQASTTAELRAAVVEAVQKATAEQQENLSSLINELLAEKESAKRAGGVGSDAVSAAFDVSAIEASVESAVQSATDELRRTITAEVKRLSIAKDAGGNVTAGAAADADMAIEIEKVFDLVQSTQSRLVAVDETVGEVFKEQAATRDSLQAMQELLQRQLDELRSTVAAATAVPAQSPTAVSDDDASEAAQQRIMQALEGLRRDVSSAAAMSAVHKDERERQLMTVAQVVSDSVTSAIQQHTDDAVQSAMKTIQEQLNALRESAEAASVAASTLSQPPASPSQAPFSQEVLSDAVEAVLSPRWAELSVQVEKMNAANQLVIEQQMLHIADSVSNSVVASLQAQLEGMRTAFESQQPLRHSEEKQDSSNTDSASAATAALIDKTTHELTALREELLQALQTQVGKTPEVNLTPMYKYIDSVLTFMKEELSLQETKLMTKMASLAETVTTAVRDQRESAQTNVILAKRLEEERAMRELKETEAATAAAVKDVPTPAAPVSALPDMAELLSPMGASLEGHAAALRRLEERLDEVGRTADVSSVLAHLQEATEQFSGASVAAAAAQTAERDALQALLRDRFTSLTQSLEDRDAQLMEAVRNAATNEGIKAQLHSMQDIIQSMSQAQKEELLASLREVAAGSEREQAQRTDALLTRMSAMQEALQEQHMAVQLLQPSPALIGLSAEQQRAQVRLRTATRDRLRRVTQLVSDLASAPAGKGTRTITKALQDELAGLRQLQEEEASLVRDSNAAGAAPVTMQSVVQAEMRRVQEEMQKGMTGLSSQGEALKCEVAAVVQSLMAKIEALEGSTGGIPALVEIQQLLDTTVARLLSQQKEEGFHVSQLMKAEASRSAVELKTAVQTALAEGLSAAERRFIPSYHAEVESTLQTHLATYSTEIKTVASTVEETTSAAVQKIETIARDISSQHAIAVQGQMALHDTPQLHLSSVNPTAHMPLWWLIANPLLVCLVVMLCIYYVFVCFLLAFVPKPSEERIDAVDYSTSPATTPVAVGAETIISSFDTVRKGGRYVDQYL
ncbi:hypothetical protein JKF63_06352 [Porcisia hertigi]|uniref:Uncharacterized protein n=1 Tax=Porcisia hertigi TaxID=2761500 RepID=A0A836LGB0_9TRYP|nr:hypothetical protein JKF63_06352 [Porcisia hertigi]